MDEQATQFHGLTLELPENAPQIRVTTGMGSAGQKTWNLRRPVTVIGSRRPAHIVLHDEGMSNAHCVIVNTGTDVLLKDLHTTNGTQLNKTRVNLAVLADGDVITLGGATMQVAIQVPDGDSDDSGAGMNFAEPTRFPGGVSLNLIHTENEWAVEEAVTLIGRHDEAAVRLDHPDLSSRHALLFRFGREPAIFDLGSRTGLWVNGQRCSLAPLRNNDRITLGPFGLSLRCTERGVGTQVPVPVVEPLAGSLIPPLVGGIHDLAPMASLYESFAAAGSTVAAPVGRPLSNTEPELENMQDNISEAWEQLNFWRAQLRDGASALEEQKAALRAREAEVDAKEVALRGQLHEISRYHEQVSARERELAAKIAQLQAEADALGEARKSYDRREKDLARREQGLGRRENAVAQRWSRLSATNCPHCRKPVHLRNVSTGPR